MPPSLLVTHIISDNENKNRCDECASTTDSSIKHLSARRGSGSCDKNFFRSYVTFILQTDFLSFKVQTGRVSSRQGNIYPKTQVDLRVIGTTMQCQSPSLQSTDWNFTSLWYIQGTTQGWWIADVYRHCIRQLKSSRLLDIYKSYNKIVVYH